MSERPEPDPFADGFTGPIAGRALSEAITLGVFEALHEGEATPHELADRLGLDPLGVETLVTALLALGYLELTDGGLRNGRDILVAALLGAEEFGFGTGVVVALGCDMARQCHLNTCPTGIATQRDDLRRKFDGTPERVIHYFTHLAEDVRGHLARLGFRKLEDVVGRVELLRTVPAERREARHATLDLSAMLADCDPSRGQPRRCVERRNNRPGNQDDYTPELPRCACQSVEP